MAIASPSALRFVLPIAAGLAAIAPAANAQTFQPNATWTSQRGSSLTIRTIAPDGSFTGTFVSHTGGACQNEPFRATGWIEGQKIAFAVRWVNGVENCEAITSWTGYLSRRGIEARWVIVHFGRSGSPVLESGMDVFH